MSYLLMQRHYLFRMICKDYFHLLFPCSKLLGNHECQLVRIQLGIDAHNGAASQCCKNENSFHFNTVY